MAMTTIEKRFWDYLSGIMGNTWDAQRHEDKYSVGIPDVSYGLHGVNGWIELKADTKWPTNGIKHLTAKQVNWLHTRGTIGGHCFLMLKVDKSILIFNHVLIYDLLEPLTKDKLIAKSIGYWDDGILTPMDKRILMNLLVG